MSWFSFKKKEVAPVISKEDERRAELNYDDVEDIERRLDAGEWIPERNDGGKGVEEALFDLNCDRVKEYATTSSAEIDEHGNIIVRSGFTYGYFPAGAIVSTDDEDKK